MREDLAVRELGVRKVLRIATYAYRRWFWRIAVTAAVVFGLAAVLAVTTDFALERVLHASPPLEAALAAYVLVGRFGGTLALVFYAGFLDIYVGDALYENRRVSLRQVLRELPWGRLLIADVILALAVQIGWVLFVIPGLLIFTAFALVGPLIVVEGHGIAPAFRRSWSLVRRHIMLVAGVVTLPALAEGSIEHAVHAFFGFEHFVAHLLVSAAVGIVVGAYCGLMEVIIARELTLAHPLRGGTTPEGALTSNGGEARR